MMDELETKRRSGRRPEGPKSDAKYAAQGRRLLKLLDEAKGYTATDAGKIYGVSSDSYKTWINGRSAVPLDAAIKIARHHNIHPYWVMTGEGEREAVPSVPKLGYVAAGDQYFEYNNDLPQESIGVVVSDDIAGAIEVRGDSMYPVYRDQDVLFIARPQTPSMELVGVECAVMLHSGAKLIKVLGGRETGGLWTLTSFNAPPMVGQDVHRVAPVLGVRRNVKRHKTSLAPR